MSIEAPATSMTFGDVRRDIISDIRAVRDRTINAAQGMALVGLYKELNNNLQVEINAARMSLATEQKAHQFGRVVQMGRRAIDGEESPPSIGL